MRTRLLSPALTLALGLPLVTLVGCPPSAETDSAPVTDADAGDYVEDAGDVHAHTAKYGGEMIEVGEHEYSLETVEKDGKLMVYVMDAHHENAVTVAPADIELELDKPDGDEVELEGEALNEADGMASEFAFALPEGMDTLEGADGHFHLTVAGKEYHVDLHAHDDHDHDHEHGDDHDDDGDSLHGDDDPGLEAAAKMNDDAAQKEAVEEITGEE